MPASGAVATLLEKRDWRKRLMASAGGSFIERRQGPQALVKVPVATPGANELSRQAQFVGLEAALGRDDPFGQLAETRLRPERGQRRPIEVQDFVRLAGPLLGE